VQQVGARIIVFGSLLAVLGSIFGCGSSTLSEPTAAVISPSSAVLLPGQSLQFSATGNGAPLTNPVWYVNNVAGGAAATGTISPSGLYTAPAGPAPATLQVSVNDRAQNTQSTPVQISIFQPNHFQPGAVSASNNPLVALYTLTAPQAASVQVQFGTTTNYGLTTSSQPAPAGGGSVSILVAGMRAGTTYHMQAMVQLPTGNTVLDADQTLTTGALPAGLSPNISVQQTEGSVPASGVELLCLFEVASQTQLTAVVTDLAGNVIWYYPMQPNPPFPMKLLANGHMLVVNGSAVQEIDLAGNIVYQVSITDLQAGLAAAGISLPTLVASLPSPSAFHHDVVKLPNGHFILLVTCAQTYTNEPGVTTVSGDALIDWDPQKGPVWTWSSFDHIPLTHAPYGTTDWTHSNAVLYSPDDGNLILSMRNQNWIVKINYDNGAGDGSILWHLGPDGDFALPEGQAPMEWNYGQHYPNLVGPSTSGIFPLLFFNNGNDRLMNTNNQVCGSAGVPACYSSVPIFQLNEYTRTAQVLQETNLSPDYSICCGNADLLANGDLEYDVAANVNTPYVSSIQEVTAEKPPQLVWQMNITGQLAYRGFRIPSLYPGVDWTQSAIATANANAKVPLAQETRTQRTSHWEGPLP